MSKTDVYSRVRTPRAGLPPNTTPTCQGGIVARQDSNDFAGANVIAFCANPSDPAAADTPEWLPEAAGKIAAALSSVRAPDHGPASPRHAHIQNSPQNRVGAHNPARTVVKGDSA